MVFLRSGIDLPFTYYDRNPDWVDILLGSEIQKNKKNI